MEASSNLNILFILNPASGGKKKINWEEIIRHYFKQYSYHIHFYILNGQEDASSISYWIHKISPQKVVAAGGDGTISVVAKQLIGSAIPLGILRGGSANGMATDLQIPQDTSMALDTILHGKVQNCDVIKINENEICIHLSDLGLNARIVKYFHKSAVHGMWGYARMLIKILLEGKPVNAHITADNLNRNIPAYMIVIANATKYGSGAVINPEGVTDDGKFELVVVRRISFIEFIKMFLSTKPFNPKKVEIFQTTKASISTRRPTHFQIDGEYIGKINTITAEIIPAALKVLVPEQKSHPK